MGKYQKIICVDFDGVIHSYLSGWEGIAEINDPPVKGSLDWLRQVQAHPDYQIAIYSSRSKDKKAIVAMKEWMHKHGLEQSTIDEFHWPMNKPAAYLTIDDRCIRFEGTFPSILEMSCYRPWTAGFKDEIQKELDAADVAAYETEQRQKAEAQHGTLDWESLAVEFEQLIGEDMYMIAVLDNDGVVVKTKVHLFEWSGYVTPFINNKDGVGLVGYLIDLNKTERRDGTVIREA